ncbi:Nicotinamide-nucleotide adenylyltransferase, NadR family / Ribosylnicotinamide kinase [Streptococcus sp. DD10]|nr:Nicotinamide-nucleotide adenylyltransferase, NadR family / Ribosylnicotinamide kinase [Streptococcus sp. DD10]
MREKVAVVFGTFAPLHQGHIDLIQEAKRYYDRVRVIVSGFDGDRGQEVGLTLQKRFRYIRETFRDDELTEVFKLNETDFPRYPLGWGLWLPALLELIHYNPQGEELIFLLEKLTIKRSLKIVVLLVALKKDNLVFLQL